MRRSLQVIGLVTACMALGACSTTGSAHRQKTQPAKVKAQADAGGALDSAIAAMGGTNRPATPEVASALAAADAPSPLPAAPTRPVDPGAVLPPLPPASAPVVVSGPDATAADATAGASVASIAAAPSAGLLNSTRPMSPAPSPAPVAQPAAFPPPAFPQASAGPYDAGGGILPAAPAAQAGYPAAAYPTYQGGAALAAAGGLLPPAPSERRIVTIAGPGAVAAQPTRPPQSPEPAAPPAAPAKPAYDYGGKASASRF